MMRCHGQHGTHKKQENTESHYPPPYTAEPLDNEPWTVSIKQALELNTELIDEICVENENSWQHMQAAPPVK